MFSVKNWLRSLALTATLASPTLASTPIDPNNVPAPVPVVQGASEPEEIPHETFQDFVNIFKDETGKEHRRRGERLKDIEEWNILEDFVVQRQFDRDYYPSQDNLEMMEDYTWDVFEDAVKELVDNTPMINELENDLRSWFSYEILGQAGNKKEDTFYSPDLAEEERKEDLQQEEVTSIKGRFSNIFGEGYEMRGGIKPYIHSMEPGIKAYGRVENFNFAGIDFRKAKVEVNTHQQARAYITKLWDKDWSSTLGAKVDLVEGEEQIYLSLGRHFKKPRARISFHAGLEDGKNVRVGFKYEARF